jgi:hypothetical protein
MSTLHGTQRILINTLWITIKKILFTIYIYIYIYINRIYVANITKSYTRHNLILILLNNVIKVRSSIKIIIKFWS